MTAWTDQLMHTTCGQENPPRIPDPSRPWCTELKLPQLRSLGSFGWSLRGIPKFTNKSRYHLKKLTVKVRPHFQFQKNWKFPSTNMVDWRSSFLLMVGLHRIALNWLQIRRPNANFQRPRNQRQCNKNSLRQNHKIKTEIVYAPFAREAVCWLTSNVLRATPSSVLAHQGKTGHWFQDPLRSPTEWSKLAFPKPPNFRLSPSRLAPPTAPKPFATFRTTRPTEAPSQTIARFQDHIPSCHEVIAFIHLAVSRAYPSDCIELKINTASIGRRVPSHMTREWGSSILHIQVGGFPNAQGQVHLVTFSTQATWVQPFFDGKKACFSRCFIGFQCYHREALRNGLLLVIWPTMTYKHLPATWTATSWHWLPDVVSKMSQEL